MAINPNEVYTDPRAKAAILMGEQTPEKEQIASKIMNEGLPQAMESLNRPTGIQTAQAAPLSGNGEVDVEGLLEQGLGPEEFARQKAFAEQQSISNWLLINEKEPVPWAKGLTWGQYIDSISVMKGPEAAEQVIKEQIKQEEEKGSQPEGDMEVRNLPTIPAPQGLQVPAGAPAAPPQGIMAAAEGGLIPDTAGGPVGEEEFMQTLASMAQGEGVGLGDIEAVAENIEAPANDNVMDSGIMQNVEAVEATESDLSGIGSLVEVSDRLVESGKERLVHATPGELIFDPSRLNEPDQRMLLAALETAGIDPNAATVGDAKNIYDEMTGLPAFGFFSGVKKFFKKAKKAVKKVGKFLKRNAGTILGIAGAMTGNPWLAALGSGIGSLIEGKPIQSALLSAGMSFAGTKWVGPWIGEQISGVASSLGTTSVGQAAGEGVGAMVPGPLAQNLASTGAQSLAATGAVKTAGEAATSALMSGATSNEAAKAAYMSMLQPFQSGGASSLATTLGKEASKEMALNLAKEAGSQLAGTTLSQGISAATQFTVPQAGLGSLIGTAPSYSVGTGIEKLLGTPVSAALGGAAAGAAQMYAQPMLEQMFIPPDQEGDVLDAWNERYNFTPSSEQLYAFYTNEYVPNQQVNVAQTIGQSPGYTDQQLVSLAPSAAVEGLGNIFQAAGGGYIKGKGGPKSDSNLALVSNGEFVMTEAATRGADPLGLGDRMRGARKMYDSMRELEARVA
jgi:hypothetical protein